MLQLEEMWSHTKLSILSEEWGTEDFLEKEKEKNVTVREEGQKGQHHKPCGDNMRVSTVSSLHEKMG